MARQFAGRLGASVEQRQAERGPGPVGEQTQEFGHHGGFVLVRHAPIVRRVVSVTTEVTWS